MNRRVVQPFLYALFVWAFLASTAVLADTNSDSASVDAAMQRTEREGCIKNLKLIYDAIQAYQMDHKDIPNWLSDLVPQYLNDPNVLVCPVCKRTGEAETSALADPNLPCSYLYEFCPLPLNKDAPKGPTRRDWKRKQMGIVGSIVPIVRCRHHAQTLNLAFDGKIYDSPTSWETIMTNLVDPAQLKQDRMYPPATKKKAAAKKPASKLKFARRPADATTNQINLINQYNAMLTQPWLGTANDDLSPLPTGLRMFDGVVFDVRGIVQLGGKSPALKSFPAQVKGIKIRQKCRRLNFLQAAAMSSLDDDGKTVGSYIVHYASNQTRVDILINYGEDVLDWHLLPGEKPAKTLSAAWIGTEKIDGTPRMLRLFKTTWTNVMPDMEIESVDFVSAMGTAAPFLVALTTE